MNPHKTVTVLVRAEIDDQLVSLVKFLNQQPGIRTFSSCIGGESYGAYVGVQWSSTEARDWLSSRYEMSSVDGRGIPVGFESCFAYIWPSAADLNVSVSPLTTTQALAELWSTICPDCGPDDYAGIVAECVGLFENLQDMRSQLAVANDECAGLRDTLLEQGNTHERERQLFRSQLAAEEAELAAARKTQGLLYAERVEYRERAKKLAGALEAIRSNSDDFLARNTADTALHEYRAPQTGAEAESAGEDNQC